MDDTEATNYRRGVARVKCMAQDRLDLSVAARIMSQFMAQPREGDDVLLKRVIRYLKKSPTNDSLLEWQERPESMTVNIDSDWARDRVTRKSTSGGTIRHGKHLICHWSKLQNTVALSSGEAELNALVKSMSESLCILNMMALMNHVIISEVATDSSATKE